MSSTSEYFSPGPSKRTSTNATTPTQMKLRFVRMSLQEEKKMRHAKVFSTKFYLFFFDPPSQAICTEFTRSRYDTIQFESTLEPLWHVLGQCNTIHRCGGIQRTIKQLHIVQTEGCSGTVSPFNRSHQTSYTQFRISDCTNRKNWSPKRKWLNIYRDCTFRPISLRTTHWTIRTVAILFRWSPTPALRPPTAHLWSHRHKTLNRNYAMLRESQFANKFESYKMNRLYHR